MNEQKLLLLEEIKRFNQINGYTPGVIKEYVDEMGEETGEAPEEGASWIPAIVAGGAGYWIGKNGLKLPKIGSILSKASSVAPVTTPAVTTLAKTSGTWGKGLPVWMKGANFVKGASVVGIGGLIASETSADPGTKAVGNIIGMGATGAALGSFGGPVGMAIGAIIGGSVGAIMTTWSEDNTELLGAAEKYDFAMNGDTWDAFDTIKKKEDLDKLQIVSSTDAAAIAEKLYTAMYGGGTNENRIIDAIDLAPSLVDVSRVWDKFGIKKGFYNPLGTFSGNMTEWIEDELTSSEENRFKNQLKNKPVLIYGGKEINTMEEWDALLMEDAEPSEDDLKLANFAEIWKDYPCVVNTAQKEGTNTKWSEDYKQVTIKIGDAMTRFSSNGKFRYKGPASGNKVTPVGTYTCSGDELAFEDDTDMAIEESRGRLSDILKESKKILKEEDVQFGDMTLELPKLGKEEVTDTETTTTTSVVYTSAPTLASVVAGKAVIKNGHKGDSVRAIQSITGAPVDGKYGPVTQKAVRAYQNGNGLGVTGIVDQATASLITNAGSTPTKPTNTKPTKQTATNEDEEIINMIAYDMEQTNTEIVNQQIEQLNIAVANQPTKEKCRELIGAAAAGCKMGVKNVNKNSLAQCYDSYNFGLSKLGRTGKSRRVKKCYGLKGRGNADKINK